MRRLLNMLPPGTVAVGAGLAVLGLAAYVHLAVAGHSLDPAAMSTVSVFWSIVYTVGLGLFLPIEQEAARLVSARRVHGVVDRALLRRVWTIAGGLLGALLLIAGWGARPIADRLFDGDIGLVWLLCGALAALALSHATRGALAGFGRFRRYGLQLGLDGGLRIALAIGVSLAGWSSAAWFCAVLVIAPILSVLCTLPNLSACTGSDVGVTWRDLGRGLGMLVVSALLAQVVVNIGVVNVRLLAPEDTYVAAALLSALVLVRIPLFVFASLQASLLPGLSAAASAGDLAGYRQLLQRTLAIVTALGVLGGIVVTLVGPQLVRLLFDAPDVLTTSDFAWLAAGTLAYMWATVLSQGVLALGHHRDQAMAWAAGVLTLIAMTFTSGGVAQRVELGYAIGSVAVVAVLVLFLLARSPAMAVARAVERNTVS